MKRLFLLFAAGCMLLTGCQRRNTAKPAMVEEISVFTESKEIFCYRSPDKVQKFLFYLRSLHPRIPAKDEFYDPADPEFLIQITYFDGKTVFYSHHGSGFLRQYPGTWQAISRPAGKKLNLLLHAMAPDA